MSYGEDLRSEIAREAARLMCEQGVKDFALAKSKATESLTGGTRAPVPSNAEIAESVRDYLEVMDGAAWASRLRGLREIAIKAMQLTSEFSPRAVGAVVNGLATPRSSVVLHVFSPFDEALDFFLGDRNIPFDDEERRVLHPSGRELRRPSCLFLADETEVELVIFGLDDRRWSPLSPIDGKPMTRWDLPTLQASLADIEA